MVSHSLTSFDLSKVSLANLSLGQWYKYYDSLGVELPPSTLQLVQIYFDTATFDDIERDKKIKMEAQLSLIGGTMGLLTGFSIISGVEIVFFLFRLVGSFRIRRADVVEGSKEKFQNHLM